MASPERTFTPEFFSVNPPVIPVKFIRPKGRGKAGPISMKGWDGFKLTLIGGNWTVITEPDMTLKCLGDGYCEIPDTKRNKEKLKQLSKPIKVRATYDRGIMRDKVAPDKFWFKNNKGVSVVLNEQAIEENEIRILDAAHEIPAVVTPLKDVRTFDINNPRLNDAELCQKVRPWLLEFVKVNGAQMEAAAI